MFIGVYSRGSALAEGDIILHFPGGIPVITLDIAGEVLEIIVQEAVLRLYRVSMGDDGMGVPAAVLHAADAPLEEHDPALLVQAVFDHPAKEEVVRLHNDAVQIALHGLVRGNDFLRLSDQRGGQALVRVDAQNPVRGDVGFVNAPVELVGVIGEFVEIYVRALFFCNFNGAVRAAAVHNHSPLCKAADGVEALAQVLFFVLGQYDCGYACHALFLPFPCRV